MDRFWQDLRYGARRLVLTPGFTFAAVVILGLAIGTNTALFSFVDELLLRPFPVPAPERLVAVKSVNQGGDLQGVSYPDYSYYRENQKSFVGVLAHTRMSFSITVGQLTERIAGDVVSDSYFTALGVPLVLGAGFPAALEQGGKEYGAVISHDLWARAFESNADVLGQRIDVNGFPFSVVGVTTKEFRGLVLSSSPDIWIPLPILEDVMPAWFRDMSLLQRRSARNLRVVGRLADGATLVQAEAEFRTLAEQLQQAYPESNEGWSVRLLDANSERMDSSQREAAFSLLPILWVVCALILVIACASVANLLLVRALARRKEIALRCALGCTRARLLTQLLTESALLYAPGMALGMVLAGWAVHALAASTLLTQVLFRGEQPLNLTVLGFAFGMTLLTSLVFGSVPFLTVSRPDLVSSLQSSFRRRWVGQRWGVQDWVVVSQVALSLVLLVGGGLLARSVQRAYAFDPGFHTENVMNFSTDFNTMAARYDDETRGTAYYEGVLSRVRNIPQVRSATWAADVPLGVRRLLIWFLPGEKTEAKESEWIMTDCNIVGSQYTQTLGIELIKGRDFRDSDRRETPAVIIINETMAQRYWPEADPVGKRMMVRGRVGVTTPEIVGVVRDVSQRELGGTRSETYLYVPLSQRYFPEMNLQVHFVGEAGALAQAVTAEMKAQDPNLPVFNITTMEEQVARSISTQRIGMALLGGSAILALVLAAVGLAGVLGYTVTRQVHPIGIRIALGARATDVLWLIMRMGLKLTLVGIALGLLASLGLARFLSTILLEVDPMDPTTFVTAATLFVGVAVLACYFPARRAMRIEPSVALRDE